MHHLKQVKHVRLTAFVVSAIERRRYKMQHQGQQVTFLAFGNCFFSIISDGISALSPSLDPT